MSYLIRARLVRSFLFASLLTIAFRASLAQSNLAIRVMAANTTSGNNQSYEAAGIRIFQGLKPDVVAIQEFKYNASSASNELRQLVNTAFGTNFHFYCEPSGNIPNGVVSRWPILAAGSWDDPFVNDRGFAWARIDLPGSNDLYIVSVHLYGSGSTGDRNVEAAIIKAHVQTNFPAGAWVVIGGDMNTDTRSEAAIGTFETFLSDSPIPDDNGLPTPNQNTSEPRSKPYDYVLPSFSLANHLTPVVLASHTLTNGLVFDSAAYKPLSDVAPVLIGDSHVSGMQHMAVVKDFLIPVGGPDTNAPAIVTAPQSLSVPAGSNATFNVVVSGTAPLAYQWRFFGTNLVGATGSSFTRTNAQAAHAGDYSVVVTNSLGSVTSAVAQLTISAAPFISAQPQSLTVNAGENAAFNVTANGDLPLSYQWRFGGVNILNATSNSYTRSNAQAADAGNYTVVITNSAGSVTSVLATLTVNSVSSGPVLARWNFNSPVADSMTTTGTRATAIGSGTNAYVGGTTAASSGEFATGSSSDTNTTDNSAWNTSSYPGSTSNNKSAGVQFNVSTAGRQNIVVAWASQASSTGSRYGRLQFSTNGLNFQDFPTAFTNGTSFTSKTNSLASFPGVNNNASFAFRLVTEFESTAAGSGNAAYVAANTGSTYGAGGTVRFDMVTVFGDPLTTSNPPPETAVLSNATFSSGQFQTLVTGSAGTNYTVQAATNLTTAPWVSLITNPAPFLFTDTNTTGFPTKFYRGRWLP